MNPENFDDGITHVAPPGEFKPIKAKRLICGKCKTEQNMIKRIIGKEFCWWCPNCKDQICDSAVSSPNATGESK